jgi:hypothetical protein
MTAITILIILVFILLTGTGGVRPFGITLSDYSRVGSIIISCCVLVTALYIILSHNYAPTEKHWAYGAVGTLMGYWLKK